VGLSQTKEMIEKESEPTFTANWTDGCSSRMPDWAFNEQRLQHNNKW